MTGHSSSKAHRQKGALSTSGSSSNPGQDGAVEGLGTSVTGKGGEKKNRTSDASRKNNASAKHGSRGRNSSGIMHQTAEQHMLNPSRSNYSAVSSPSGIAGSPQQGITH